MEEVDKEEVDKEEEEEEESMDFLHLKISYR